jgi:protocatechuate 3,4-dioxygenase beta subunit
MKLLAFCVAALFLAAQPVREAPSDAPSTGRVASPGEPGDRLTVDGVVVTTDGSPVRDASIYVYQTDAEGYYGVKPVSDNRNPRLKLFLRSAGNGTWSFDTIRPGSYPGSRVPAHIHFEVSAPRFAPRIFEIVFEGDPFITEGMRSNPAFSVRRIESGRVTERIVLRREQAQSPSPTPAPPRGPRGSGFLARSARCAAQYPHMPCTPAPGGVEAEHR